MYGEITVQPEESLGIYADWLKLEKSRLRNINALASRTSVHPGQQLKLQFSGVSKDTFEKLRHEFHMETEEDFFKSYKVTGFRKYQVAMGDTLWDICQKKFDLPLWLLKKYNNINYNQLNYNQDLRIPVIEAL